VRERRHLDRHDVQDALGFVGRERFEAGSALPPVHQGITLQIAGIFLRHVSQHTSDYGIRSKSC
jgi:hypothetical protein